MVPKHRAYRAWWTNQNCVHQIIHPLSTSLFPDPVSVASGSTPLSYSLVAMNLQAILPPPFSVISFYPIILFFSVFWGEGRVYLPRRKHGC